MAEGTYEYACARAELLGQREPTIDEFNAEKDVEDATGVQRAIDGSDSEAHPDEDEQSAEQINGADAAPQSKYEKFNGILSITQQRINKFKVACGSLTNLLKLVPTYAATENEAANGGGGGNGIDDALDTLEQIKDAEAASSFSLK